MATGKDSDLLPVRRATKQALAAVKGQDSYDELLTELLRVVPPEVLRRRIDARREAQRRVVEARRGQPEPLRRGPDKQLLIAAAAERRWRRWLSQGRVVRLGPRRYRWTTGWRPPGVPGGVRLARRPGRGLAP